MHCTLFFFNDTASTEIYTLSLHDALPIFACGRTVPVAALKAGTGLDGFQLASLDAGDERSHKIADPVPERAGETAGKDRDRKSTRLNSSHANISYAVFCLKKKKLQI